MIFAVKNKKIVLILLFIITIILGFFASKINFNHDIESFLNTKSNDYKTYNRILENFKNENDSTQKILIICNNNKPINHSFLLSVNELCRKLQETKKYLSVHSITNYKLPVKGNIGSFKISFFHESEPEIYSNDSSLLSKNKHIESLFISEDYQSTIVFLEINIPPQKIITEIEYLKSQLSQSNIPSYLFYNSEFIKEVTISKLQKESIILTSISLLLIIVILIFFYRSIWGVIIPMTIVLTTVIWILGIMSSLGFSLNVMSMAIPVIVAVISLSDVIHIINRFSEEKAFNSFDKIKITQRDILKAILLTSITTSVGFLTLLTTNTKAFNEFGLFTTVGVFIAFIIAFTLLPILLSWKSTIELHSSIRFFTPIKPYAKYTLLISFLTIPIVFIGIFKLENKSHLFEDYHAQDEASKAISSIQQDFWGIREFIIDIRVKNGNIKDYEVAKQLNQFYTELNKKIPLKSHQSFLSSIYSVNQYYHQGKSEFYSFPKDETEYDFYLTQMNKFNSVLKLENFINSENDETIMLFKTKDSGSIIAQKHVLEIKNIATNTLSSENFNLSMSGQSIIMDRTSFNITNNMFFSLIFIIIFIFILILIVYKSFRLAFISIIPNVIPLFVLLGIIGWFDFGLNISSTIVFTIAFGIAVDDTIHFISRYQIEKNDCHSISTAITNTLSTSGSAISLTTIILTSGFGVLILSGFYANFMTGLLVSIALIIALISDLFLLPLLLLYFDKE